MAGEKFYSGMYGIGSKIFRGRGLWVNEKDLHLSFVERGLAVWKWYKFEVECGWIVAVHFIRQTIVLLRSGVSEMVKQGLVLTLYHVNFWKTVGLIKLYERK